MITTQWWVLPTVFFAGAGFAGFCATIWRAHLDALGQVLARTPEPEPEPQPTSWDPPTPPWADHRLALPQAPDVDTSWRGFGERLDGSRFAGEDTISFQAIGFVMPEPTQVEVVDEPTADPRARFAGEPRPAKEVTVTTVLADPVMTKVPAEVRAETVWVKA